MIRNVVLHLHGELPMKADIESLPTAADAGLLCTNLRTLEGRKPISIEFLDSVFLIPYNLIRFIEIPREAIHAAGLDRELPEQPTALPAEASAVTGDHHVLAPPPPAWGPGAAGGVGGPGSPGGAGPAMRDEAIEHLEPDAELLRRIRDA